MIEWFHNFLEFKDNSSQVGEKASNDEEVYFLFLNLTSVCLIIFKLAILEQLSTPCPFSFSILHTLIPLIAPS